MEDIEMIKEMMKEIETEIEIIKRV